MRILYFGSLRELAGRTEESVNVPSSICYVSDLVEWIKQRGGGPGEVMMDLSRVRIAVNLVYADSATRLTQNDEVAFFPPMTGGSTW